MVRKINEDAFLDSPRHGLWAVADGMGGHAAGDYVASFIVDSLRSVQPEQVLPNYTCALHAALTRVNEEVRKETLRRGMSMMGSTVVVFAVRRNRGVCLWAGDSRLYRLRDGTLQCITRDHSYVQSLQDSGLLSAAEARVHPRANIVTRAVGVEDGLALDMIQLEILPGNARSARARRSFSGSPQSDASGFDPGRAGQHHRHRRSGLLKISLWTY
jgi:serine/threonine-protein phosphatase Stp1